MVFFLVKMRPNDTLALEAAMVAVTCSFLRYSASLYCSARERHLVRLLKFISSSSKEDFGSFGNPSFLCLCLSLSEGDISVQIRKHEESKSLLIRINPRLDLAFCIPSFA